MGVDFFARVIQMEDGTKIKLQLLGAAWQERYNATNIHTQNSGLSFTVRFRFRLITIPAIATPLEPSYATTSAMERALSIADVVAYNGSNGVVRVGLGDQHEPEQERD